MTESLGLVMRILTTCSKHQLPSGLERGDQVLTCTQYALWMMCVVSPIPWSRMNLILELDAKANGTILFAPKVLEAWVFCSKKRKEKKEKKSLSTETHVGLQKDRLLAITLEEYNRLKCRNSIEPAHPSHQYTLSLTTASETEVSAHSCKETAEQ